MSKSLKHKRDRDSAANSLRRAGLVVEIYDTSSYYVDVSRPHTDCRTGCPGCEISGVKIRFSDHPLPPFHAASDICVGHHESRIAGWPQAVAKACLLLKVPTPPSIATRCLKAEYAKQAAFQAEMKRIDQLQAVRKQKLGDLKMSDKQLDQYAELVDVLQARLRDQEELEVSCKLCALALDRLGVPQAISLYGRILLIEKVILHDGYASPPKDRWAGILPETATLATGSLCAY